MNKDFKNVADSQVFVVLLLDLHRSPLLVSVNFSQLFFMKCHYDIQSYFAFDVWLVRIALSR